MPTPDQEFLARQEQTGDARPLVEEERNTIEGDSATDGTVHDSEAVFEYWRNKFEERLKEIADQSRRENLIADLPISNHTQHSESTAPDIDTQQAHHPVFVFSKKRTSKSGRAIERAKWKLIERIHHPDRVQKAVDALETMCPQIERISEPNVGAARAKKLRRMGFHPIKHDSVMGITHERTVRPTFSQSARRGIDYICESVEYPAETLAALHAVGIQYDKYTFATPNPMDDESKYRLQTICALCSAAQGKEDILMALGRDVQWASIQAGKTKVITIAEFLSNDNLLSPYRNKNRRAQLVSLIAEYESAPSFDYLPDLTSGLDHPEVLRGRNLFAPRQLYDADYSKKLLTIRTITRLRDAHVLQELDYFFRCGVQIPAHIYYQLHVIQNLVYESDAPISPESTASHKTHASKLQESIVAFQAQLHTEFGSVIDDQELSIFMRQFHDITGMQLTVNDIQKFSDLRGQRNEILALAAFLSEYDAAWTSRLQLNDLIHLLSDRAILAQSLEPAYTDFLLHMRDVHCDFMVDHFTYSILEILGREEVREQLRVMYENSNIRHALLDDRSRQLFQELAANAGRSNEKYLFDVSSDGVVLAKILERESTDYKKLFSVLRQYDVHITSLAQIEREHDVFDIFFEHLAVLEQPATLDLYTQIHECTSAFSSRYTSGRQSHTLKEVQETLRIAADPEEYANFHNEATVRARQTLIQKMQHSNIYSYGEPAEILHIRDSDDITPESVDEYTAWCRGIQFSIDEFLIFLHCKEDVLRGADRLGNNFHSFPLATIAEVGHNTKWSAATELLLMFDRDVQRDMNCTIAISKDVEGFREFIDFLCQSSSDVDKTFFNPREVQRLANLAPMRAVIQQCSEDFAHHNAPPLLFREIIILQPTDLEPIAQLNARDRSAIIAKVVECGQPGHGESRFFLMRQFIALYINHAAFAEQLDSQFGERWWREISSGHLALFTGEKKEQYFHTSQRLQALGLEYPETRMDIVAAVIERNLLPIIEESSIAGYSFAEDHIGFYLELQKLKERKKIRDATDFFQLFQRYQKDFSLSLEEVMNCPDQFVAFAHDEIVQNFIALMQKDECGKKFLSAMLENIDAWKIAALHPDAMEALFTLSTIVDSLNVQDIKLLVECGPKECVSFVQWARKILNEELSHSHFFHLCNVVKYRATVTRLVVDCHISLHECLFNRHVLPVAEEFFAMPQILSAELLQKRLGYQLNILDIPQIMTVVHRGLWDRLIAMHDEWGISVSCILKDISIFDVFSIFDPALVEQERTPGESREQQFHWAHLIQILLSGDSATFDHIFDREAGARNKLLLERPSTIIHRFVEKYPASDKGKTIAVLTAACEYESGDAPAKTIQRICERLDFYSHILNRYDPAKAPVGVRASIGMEYEVTGSVGEAYRQHFGNRAYSQDAQRFSQYGHVGRGNDGIHEFATHPTDNPYLLLLEMQLLQDLEMTDFNFELPGYERASRGMHMTIGGEGGLRLNFQTNFLQNALVLSGWGGVNAGEEVRGLAYGRAQSVRQRFGVLGEIMVMREKPSVEFRSLSLDRWEPFERTVLTSFYGAMAIQAVEEYCAMPSVFVEKIADHFPSNEKSFFDFLAEQKVLVKEVKDARVRTMIYEWCRLQAGMIRAVADHNENFAMNETVGYTDDRGQWVEPEEFGGKENMQRFANILRSQQAQSAGVSIDQIPMPTSDEVMQNLQSKQIPSDMLFCEVRHAGVNILTQIHNLYLKPAARDAMHGIADARVNALAMLQTTKLDAQHIEDADPRALTQSVFERKSDARRGYYALQGGSDQLITHRTQQLLMRFLEQMQKAIEVPQLQEEVLPLAA